MPYLYVHLWKGIGSCFFYHTLYLFTEYWMRAFRLRWKNNKEGPYPWHLTSTSSTQTTVLEDLDVVEKYNDNLPPPPTQENCTRKIQMDRISLYLMTQAYLSL